MSAFLNRYCTSIAPYPGAFISLISTHRRLIYSSAPVSPFWRTQVVLASIRLFAAVFLTTLKRRGCSILRYMTTVVHLVCFSRVLRAAHVDPVRVHKRSPTLANHAFHCSQVASRSITVAVCGRSGCSSRLHSGYSSKIVRSSHPPRQKKFAVPLLPLRCPRQPQPQGFGRIASDYRWSRTTHEAFWPVLSVALLNLYPARRRRTVVSTNVQGGVVWRPGSPSSSQQGHFRLSYRQLSVCVAIYQQRARCQLFFSTIFQASS